MKIAYIFDQPLPGKEADQMQLINTIAALSRHGCEVTLFLPASNVDDLPTADALREYYKIDAPFKLDCIHSIFPGPRIAEKVVHPLLCTTLLRKKLRTFDLVYSRNIPAIVTSLSTGMPTMYDTYRPWHPICCDDSALQAHLYGSQFLGHSPSLRILAPSVYLEGIRSA